MELDDLHKIAKLYASILKVFCHMPIKDDTLGYGQGQIRILIYLAEHPDGVLSGNLSSEIHVGTGRIGNALKEMEKKGLIKRYDDIHDKRKTIVKITNTGQKLADQRRNKFINLNKRIIEKIGYDEFYHFLQTFKKIVEIENELDINEEVKKHV